MVCEQLTDHIAPVKSPWGLIQLILNIIFPGTGTILNSCMATKFNATTFIVGILQFILAYILIGWIWSIWWGILIVEKSRDL